MPLLRRQKRRAPQTSRMSRGSCRHRSQLHRAGFHIEHGHHRAHRCHDQRLMPGRSQRDRRGRQRRTEGSRVRTLLQPDFGRDTVRRHGNSTRARIRPSCHTHRPIHLGRHSSERARRRRGQRCSWRPRRKGSLENQALRIGWFVGYTPPPPCSPSRDHKPSRVPLDLRRRHLRMPNHPGMLASRCMFGRHLSAPNRSR